MAPNHTTSTTDPATAGRVTPTEGRMIAIVSAMKPIVNAPRKRWILFSMMNIRALRTSRSMRVKATNVSPRRPLRAAKKPMKPNVTRGSAMRGPTLSFSEAYSLPISISF